MIPYLRVNGGLTFSASSDEVSWEEIPEGIEGWVVGFDTFHSWDSPEMWPEEEVMRETLKLKEQLESYGTIR